MAITATCIRVPVVRAHAESINLEFDRAMDEAEARALLAEAPGVTIVDDRDVNVFPTPLEASFQDDVFVGRIREDISRAEGGAGSNGKQGKTGIDMFVCGDQIRKGAALNAVQIAELLLKQ